MLDVIKSYLVSLGFQVNEPEYKKAQDALDSMTRFVQSHTEGMAKSYVSAAVTITTALASVATATASLIDQVAKADLEYQKFALHMYMVTNQAKQLKIVTDSMGESLENIAWIPELRERYFALMQQARGMETPGDAAGQLRYMRDIRYEFTRLRVEATYATQWISYYLIKYLAGPLGDIRSALKSLNDWIQQNMPIWTDKVARWLVMIINLGKSAWRTIMNIVDAFKALWNSLGDGQKELATFGMILLAFFIFGPFGRVMMILGSAVLLLDDFYAYIDGRKSSKKLAPIWETIRKVFGDLQGDLAKLNKEFEDFWNKFLPDQKKFSIWDEMLNGLQLTIRTFGLLSEAVLGFFEVQRLVSRGDLEGAKKARDQLNRRLSEDAGRIWNENIMGRPPENVVELEPGPASSGGGAPGQAQIMAAAQRVSAKTGIPAEWIYGQWYHETNGFTNWGARNANNLAGMKQHKANPPGVDARSPEGDNYQIYGSVDEFADYFADYLGYYRGDGVFNARTPEEYAAALRHGGYYGPQTSAASYAGGIRRGMAVYGNTTALSSAAQTYQSYAGGNYQPAGNGGYVVHMQTGDIIVNVDKPSATADDIYWATLKAMQDSAKTLNIRNTKEAAGVFG